MLIRWLPGVYWVSIRWLQGVYQVATRCLQGFYQVATRSLQGVLSGGYQVFTGCLPGGYRVSIMWLPGLYKVSIRSRWLPGVYRVSIRWLPGVYRVCIRWIPGVYRVSIICIISRASSISPITCIYLSNFQGWGTQGQQFCVTVVGLSCVCIVETAFSGSRGVPPTGFGPMPSACGAGSLSTAPPS